MSAALPTALMVVYLFALLHAVSASSYNMIIKTENRSTKKHCLTENGNRTSWTTTLRLLIWRPFGELASPRESINRVNKRYTAYDTSRDNGGILPALDLAVEQINNRSDILPCYKLEMLHIETDCESTTNALIGLTNVLFLEERAPVVGALIVPNCPRLSLEISAFTNRPEIQMVLLHNSDSSLLADRKKYPYSLGILTSTQSFVNLSLTFIKESGWRSIAFLYDGSHPYYYSILRHLIASVKSELNNVTIKYISTLSSNFYPLDQVRYSKTRIVFAFTPLEQSKRMMCLAHHMKLIYPSYQWIFINQRLGDFACEDTISTYQWGRYYNCSCQLLVNHILEGTFLISYQISTSNTVADATFPQNTSFGEFLELYNQQISAYNHKLAKKNLTHLISSTRWAYDMYDAVWAWAVVLDKLTASYNNRHTFDYGNKLLAESTLKEFYSLNFQGKSGQMTFNSNTGFVDRSVNLYQVVGGYEKKVAAYRIKTTDVVILQKFVSIPDAVRVVSLPHIGVVCFFLIVHFLQLLIVVSLHMLTFLYRNNKYVKASSPKLIQPAFCGTYVSILSMICYQLYFTHELSSVVGNLLCKAVWIWLLPTSFTMMMGIITLRAWRLYRIFTHYMNPGKFISNFSLVVILLILVVIDVIFAIVRTFVDRMQFTFIEYTPKPQQMDHLLFDQQCVSSAPVTWILVYGYKICLLFVMIVLSILTHHIPNQTFSTALLRVFSYVYSLSFVIGFVLYFMYTNLFNSRSNTDFYIFSVLTSILLLTFISLVVAPPLLPVMQSKLKSVFYSNTHVQSIY